MYSHHDPFCTVIVLKLVLAPVPRETPVSPNTGTVVPNDDPKRFTSGYRLLYKHFGVWHTLDVCSPHRGLDILNEHFAILSQLLGSLLV